MQNVRPGFDLRWDLEGQCWEVGRVVGGLPHMQPAVCRSCAVKGLSQMRVLVQVCPMWYPSAEESWQAYAGCAVPLLHRSALHQCWVA